MSFANQSFPPITARFLKPKDEHWLSNDSDVKTNATEGQYNKA